MPKQEGQKRKLLVLLRILEQQTDKDHRLTVPQLAALLEQQGIPCERKSVYSDLDTLRALGYDIGQRRGRGGGYWLAHRAFDLPELKLLADAVQASRFISEKNTRLLIQKLKGQTSVHQAAQLQRQVFVRGRGKSENERVLLSVDALHTAINSGKMVRFGYKRGRGRAAATHTVSPWQLAWDNGNYYLIAYQDEKEPPDIRNYRLDRMQEVRVVDTPRRGKEHYGALDLPAYLSKRFEMFSGTEYTVTLRCKSDLEAVMRERFGRGPIFVPEGGGWLHFDAPVCVSERFFGWVFGFGGEVEIAAPPEVRAQMQQLAQRVAVQHEG